MNAALVLPCVEFFLSKKRLSLRIHAGNTEIPKALTTIRPDLLSEAGAFSYHKSPCAHPPVSYLLDRTSGDTSPGTPGKFPSARSGRNPQSRQNFREFLTKKHTEISSMRRACSIRPYRAGAQNPKTPKNLKLNSQIF